MMTEASLHTSHIYVTSKRVSRVPEGCTPTLYHCNTDNMMFFKIHELPFTMLVSIMKWLFCTSKFLPTTQKYFNSFFFAQIGLLLKMANSRPLFYIFVHSTVNSKLKFLIKILRWLHLNCGPEVFEATTLPSKSKPLPQIGLHSNRHRQIHSLCA